MRRILSLALFTYRELVRSKLLFVWLISAVLFCGLALLLSLLSFGDILNIFMDLGLVGMEISGLLVLLLGLAVTYTTEMDQKAIFLHLSKPLTRAEYLLGRILGFFLVNALVVVGMALLVAGLVIFVGGGQVPGLFYAAVGGVLLEMFVLTVLGLTFQMIATSMVGVVLYTFFTVFLGHFIGEIQWLLEKQLGPVTKFLLQAVYYILPNLQIFNIRDRVYDPTFVLAWAQGREILLYAFAYSFMVFLVGWISLEKREFK
jgi:ABC-type transport system involved in multi-copper enzyme maturation permease subunit